MITLLPFIVIVIVIIDVPFFLMPVVHCQLRQTHTFVLCYFLAPTSYKKSALIPARPFAPLIVIGHYFSFFISSICGFHKSDPQVPLLHLYFLLIIGFQMVYLTVIIFRNPIVTGTSVLGIKFEGGVAIAADTLGIVHYYNFYFILQFLRFATIQVFPAI